MVLSYFEAVLTVILKFARMENIFEKSFKIKGFLLLPSLQLRVYSIEQAGLFHFPC